MSARSRPREPKRMSDAAVRAKTAKTWKEWFGILDRAGARKMYHKEIVAHLATHHKLGPWWQQMVTVAYEQARGLRELYQKPEGFEVSASKTIAAPLRSLFCAWTEQKLSRRWLPAAKFEISKATPNKSVRLKWADATRVSVMFYPKGVKSQVTVQHGRLANAAADERTKSYWKGQLNKLATLLERN